MHGASALRRNKHNSSSPSPGNESPQASSSGGGGEEASELNWSVDSFFSEDGNPSKDHALSPDSHNSSRKTREETLTAGNSEGLWGKNSSDGVTTAEQGEEEAMFLAGHSMDEEDLFSMFFNQEGGSSSTALDLEDIPQQTTSGTASPVSLPLLSSSDFAELSNALSAEELEGEGFMTLFPSLSLSSSSDGTEKPLTDLYLSAMDVPTTPSAQLEQQQESSQLAPTIDPAEATASNTAAFHVDLTKIKVEPIEGEERNAPVSTTSSPSATHALSSNPLPLPLTTKAKTEQTSSFTAQQNSKAKTIPTQPAKRTTAASTRKPSTRPTKKPKVEPSGAADPSSPFLQSLVGLSSTELMEYAKNNPLTPQQKLEMKKQIRMMKNRESAQLSRERRKEHQKELEDIIDRETQRHAVLSEQLIELQAENRVLQRELEEFKQILENSYLAEAYARYKAGLPFTKEEPHATTASSSSIATTPLPAELAVVPSSKAKRPSPKAETAFAVYMMILLHHFGKLAGEAAVNASANALAMLPSTKA
ncbi:hypothetical protein QOT17_009906 [Balamuthia mandrillaris]